MIVPCLKWLKTVSKHSSSCSCFFILLYATVTDIVRKLVEETYIIEVVIRYNWQSAVQPLICVRCFGWLIMVDPPVTPHIEKLSSVWLSIKALIVNRFFWNLKVNNYEAFPFEWNKPHQNRSSQSLIISKTRYSGFCTWPRTGMSSLDR